MDTQSQSSIPRRRKRDVFKQIASRWGKAEPATVPIVAPASSISSVQQSPPPSTNVDSANASIPGSPGCQVTEGMESPSLSEPQVAQKKSFIKSNSFEKDIAVLFTSYLFTDDIELKRLISLMEEIRDADEDDELIDVLEICAKFTVHLVSITNAHPDEAIVGIKEFVQTLEGIKTAQSKGNSQPNQDLKTLVNRNINVIRTSHPSLNSNKDGTSGHNLVELLDTVIGAGVTVFDILKDASMFIPVPLLQVAVSSVSVLLKAVDQTRSNFNDMKRITATAGHFVVALAVTCASYSASPPKELIRALKAFTQELQGIAQECEELSRMNPCHRFLQQNANKGDLQAIRTKLDDAMKLFQAKSHINIELKLNDLTEKIDHLALSNLPDHPRYEANEYMEGSRQDAIQHISDWIGTSKDVVFWMHGVAGLGKSTISQQLVKHLRNDDRLAGGVFMTLQPKEHPTRVIEMLSKQLGQMHPRAVSDIVKATKKVCGPHTSLCDYLSAYIMEPVRALNYPYQLVVVVDGIEEWTSYEPFLKELEHLPSPCPVKFILTGRPNHPIEPLLDKVMGTIRKFPLPPVPKEVIEEYLKHHFKDINWRGRRPDETKISQLADLADGLLIWVATVRSLLSHEMDERYPHQILDEILHTQEKVGTRSGEQLGRLYEDAIKRLFPDSEHPDMPNRFRIFIGGMLVLQESLTILEFAHLSGIPERPAQEIQRRLTALQTRGDVQVERVVPALQIFHASGVEFFSSYVSARDVDGMSGYHAILARNCLQVVFMDLLSSPQSESCKFSDLRGVEAYAVRFWPLHFSCGSQRQCSTGRLTKLLEGISEESLYRWALLFLSSISIEDQGNSLRNTSKSELLLKMAEILNEKGTEAQIHQIRLLEVGARLSNDLLTWIALGRAYHLSYKCGGQQRDLDEKIEVLRGVLELNQITPCLERSLSLNILATALQTRFEQRGSPDDLDECTSLNREALELRPVPHPERSFSLNNLALALRTRFEQRGSLDDLDECISLNTEALELPAPHSDRSVCLNNLAAALQTRFEQRGSPDDLDNCISLNREALELRPVPHPNRHFSLNNLALALQARFEQRGSPDDLDESISLNKKALELLPTSHPSHSISAGNLAEGLRARFKQQGSPDDLDESISLNRKTLELRPAPHPDRPLSLSNLALSLEARFGLGGSQDDLDELISLHREALKLRPTSHPDRSFSLNNLAVSLHTRFEQQGLPDDLDESISLHRKALGLRPAPHPNRSISIGNLAEALRTRFEKRGFPDDLEESITLNREALEFLSATHSDRSSFLNNAALALRNRFELKGSSADLDEAILFYQQVLDSSSQNQKQYSRALDAIPSVLRKRHLLQGDNSDLDQAIHFEGIKESRSQNT